MGKKLWKLSYPVWYLHVWIMFEFWINLFRVTMVGGEAFGSNENINFSYGKVLISRNVYIPFTIYFIITFVWYYMDEIKPLTIFDIILRSSILFSVKVHMSIFSKENGKIQIWRPHKLIAIKIEKKSNSHFLNNSRLKRQ